MELTNDLNAVYVGVIIIVTVFASAMSGSLLVALVRIANNRQALQIAESQFNKSDQQTKQFIELTHQSLVILEGLAKALIPGSELAKAVDIAEDVIDEIRDGVPVDTKPFPDIPPPQQPTTFNDAVG